MKEITSNTKVYDILENYEGAKALFIKLGYKCVDCAVNSEDSLMVAAKYHHKDLNELIKCLYELSPKNNQ